MDRSSKRQRRDIDYVYPFDASLLVPLPPFIEAGSGLTVEGTKLAINYTNPITAKNDALGLKIGEGLALDQNGNLTASASAVTVLPPLASRPEGITLAYGNGLDMQDSALVVKASSPLFADESGVGLRVSAPLADFGGSLSVSTGDGLTITDSALTASVQAPLVFKTGAISIDTSAGLYVQDGKLSLQTVAPLLAADAGLQLSYGGTLEVQGSALDVKLKQDGGLDKTGGLNVKTGPGMEVTAAGLAPKAVPPLQLSDDGISLKYRDPIGVDTDSLYLKIGSGLQVDESGQLAAVNSAAVTASPPLSVTDGNVALAYGAGLQLETNKLTVKAQGPISVSEALGIGLDTDLGLEIRQDKLTVKTVAPILATGPGIALSYTDGLEVSGSALRVKLSATGALKFDGGLAVKYNAPISADASGLKLDVAPPLRIRNNQLQMTTAFPLTVANQAITLNLDPPLRNGTNNKLQVAVQAPMAILNSALALRYSTDFAVESTNNSLVVKLQNDSGIDKNHLGLKVNTTAPLNTRGNIVELKYSTQDFQLDSSGALKLLPKFQSSPFVYADYGNEGLNEKVAVFVKGKDWNTCFVRPYISVNWGGGTVNGILRMRIVGTDFANMNTTDPIQFGLVFDPESSITQSPPLKHVIPSEPVSLTKLQPSNFYVPYSKSFETLPYTSSELLWQLPIVVHAYTKSYKSFPSSTIYLSTIYKDSKVMLYFACDILLQASANFFQTPGNEIIVVSAPFSYSGLQYN